MDITVSPALTFKEQLRHYRKQRGFSVVRLAERTGLAKATLDNWQAGRTLPSAPELEALLSALELGSFDQRLLRRAVGLPRAIARLPEGERPPLTGGLLRAMRLRRGMTQSEVASKLAIRQGTLAKWEKSDDWPEADKLSLLCAVLGAKPQEVEAILGGVFLPLPLPLKSSLDELDQHVNILHHRINQQPNDPLLDLALLELESQLWLDADRPATQELLWEVWGFHNNYLSLNQRYQELFFRSNQMVHLTFDSRKKNSFHLQNAVIYKSLALWSPQNVNVESASRQKRAIAFLRASEGHLSDPESQAWYWMVLADLLIVDRAYDEACICLDRSNAIPHPEYERGTMRESALITVHHLTNLGSPREALALLDSLTLEERDSIPMTAMRSLLYRARALAKLDDFAGALEVLGQLYNQIEETGINVLRPRAEALYFQLMHIP